MQAPGFAVHHLGVSWNGAEQAGRLRLRYADGWHDWQDVVAADSQDDRRRTLLWVGDATAYQFAQRQVVARSGCRPSTPSTVPQQQRSSCQRSDWHASMPQTSPTLPTPPGFPRPLYRSRAGWGADESLRFGPDGTESFPTAFFDVQTLTVHHTVTINSDPDPAATVRAIYFFHAVTEDFGDIGYHLLIDQHGTVYEGRYSGPDPLPVFGPRQLGPGRRWSTAPTSAASTPETSAWPCSEI